MSRHTLWMPDSPYDAVAAMYHRLWADWYLPAALPALESLFFSQVKVGSRVLDLCCGSGHVTKELAARGYRVTGVDNSAELIKLAQAEYPELELFVQDVRRLALDRKYYGVLSTFDSLNHILELDELRDVFRRVYHALEGGGVFVFDMNLEQAYLADLRQWVVDVQDLTVGLVRGQFDPAIKRASTELIWFTKNPDGECWQQTRSRVEQQCYAQGEILQSLSDAGFREVESMPAIDAGVTAELGFGRMYFVARSGIGKDTHIDPLRGAD